MNRLQITTDQLPILTLLLISSKTLKKCLCKVELLFNLSCFRMHILNYVYVLCYIFILIPFTVSSSITFLTLRACLFTINVQVTKFAESKINKKYMCYLLSEIARSRVTSLHVKIKIIFLTGLCCLLMDMRTACNRLQFLSSRHHRNHPCSLDS